MCGSIVGRFWLGVLGLAGLLVPVAGGASAAEPLAPSLERVCAAEGVTGGLCVLAACGDVRSAVSLGTTGRYLVHVLEPEAAVVERMRTDLQQQHVYGLVSADRLAPDNTLPYTENLVNALLLGDGPRGRLLLAESVRVLAPGGLLLVSDQGPGAAELAAAGLEVVSPARSGWTGRLARKPRPPAMDQWSHARHAADGNPVSQDRLVGPPRRVRWLAGPPQEISNMVTAGGRAFYAGVLARDGFNGLRLWEQTLDPSPARGGFYFPAVPGSVQPIATEKLLLVMTGQMLQALDAATGQLVRQYPEAGFPDELLLAGETIVAVGTSEVRAVELETARLRWKHNAPHARSAVAGDGMVLFVQGDPRRAEVPALVCRELASGGLRWQRTQDELAWLAKVRRCVYHQGLVVCEQSTLNEDRAGNAIHVLSAADGKALWSRSFTPRSSHFLQARAMFAAGLLWVLDEEQKGCVGLDPHSGTVQKTWPIGMSHCFPPVATCRYMLAGEMDLTDLETGRGEVSHITKQACSRDAGVVPANGLIYAFPKRCICWPMLRDHAALAPALPGQELPWDNLRLVPELGPARPPQDRAAEDPQSQWPCSRHDALRSGSTLCRLPADLRILWTTDLGVWPTGPIADDWRDNYFSRGPVGPPVAAAGLVYVARPNAHQVVALEARTGQIRWTFTANGPVDTAPTIQRGLCLFGSRSGWVYCLRADDGGLVWRLRVAPSEQRIVAFGQIESPWPVPGSVLVVEDTAYFAAGRQPLADGGILVLAVEPATGRVRWTQRLDQVPLKNFYASSAMDFENFDLLHQEGDAVAMSRWLFERSTGQLSCLEASGFARLGTGDAAVLFPRGSWSYAPPYEPETWLERPFVQPLAVLRGNSLYGSSQDRRTLFRRDFRLAAGEKFDTTWVGKNVFNAKYGRLWRSQLLARDAAWSVVPFPLTAGKQEVSALLLAGDALYAASSRGGMVVVDARTGEVQKQVPTPPAAWDGLAAADGRLFLATQDGRLVCLGQAAR